jgi:hypothetical protein
MGLELTREGDVYLGTVQRRELSPSTAVVYAVAAILEEDPLALTPPLSAAVDPDALDQLFGQRPDTASSTVSFTLWGCAVTVEPPNRLRIERVCD